MGKIPTNSLSKPSELELHCFCLYNAYSMPKDIVYIFFWSFSMDSKSLVTSLLISGLWNNYHFLSIHPEIFFMDWVRHISTPTFLLFIFMLWHISKAGHKLSSGSKGWRRSQILCHFICDDECSFWIDPIYPIRYPHGQDVGFFWKVKKMQFS